MAGCRRRQESPRGDQNLRAAGREGELSGASGALSLAKAVLQPFHIVTPAKAMAKAKKIRITSKAGTDLTMSKEGRKGHKRVGVSDYPGIGP